MAIGNELDKATERLDNALQSIEDAVAAKRHNDLTNDSLLERVQSLETNLKSERDQNEELSETTKQVSERIDSAMASIEEILRGN